MEENDDLNEEINDNLSEENNENTEPSDATRFYKLHQFHYVI